MLQPDAEMKEIQHLELFAFCNPTSVVPAARHMINDCSPQHFTLAHFTDGLPDKKALLLCVCGAASAG